MATTPSRPPSRGRGRGPRQRPNPRPRTSPRARNDNRRPAGPEFYCADGAHSAEYQYLCDDSFTESEYKENEFRTRPWLTRKQADLRATAVTPADSASA